MFRFIILFLILLSGSAMAHQFTPTYPKLSLSFIQGVYKTEMLLFNSREDISYYVLNVFNSEWKPVKFATENRLVKINYLERRNINIYVRKEDREDVTYICSKSKTLAKDKKPSIVTSRICSKIK
tara:strand:- start:3260 stop:3634 length:375 start_codon:yes stop_codon:yes gene_type:complete